MRRNDRKLTRNSFKRKVIVFGVAIFMSVAMVATGFAAWIVSSNAKADGEIGVNVATITNASITITYDNAYFNDKEEGASYQVHKEQFSFCPVETDKTGKVKTNVEDDEYEKLTIKIKGRVDGLDYLDSLTLTIDFGEKLRAAEANGFIVLPETTIVLNADDAPAGQYTVTPSVGIEGEDGYAPAFATFDYDIVLEWGALYAGLNPCYYYDCVDEAGADLTDELLAASKYTTVAALQALTVEQIMADLAEMNAAVQDSIVKVTVEAATN